jgi:hypothetical protein
LTLSAIAFAIDVELLASCRDGCTEEIMLAHGFTIDMMVHW